MVGVPRYKEIFMSAKNIALATAAAGAWLIATPGTGEARIVCEGEFQVNSGQYIATPACADRYLAQVARGYGMRVSHIDIRNPSVKARVCEFVGNDIRLQTICSGWRNNQFGGPRMGF
jgi:hypothetical protein